MEAVGTVALAGNRSRADSGAVAASSRAVAAAGVMLSAMIAAWESGHAGHCPPTVTSARLPTT